MTIIKCVRKRLKKRYQHYVADMPKSNKHWKHITSLYSPVMRIF